MKTLLFSLILFCLSSAIAQEKEFDPTAADHSPKFYLGWVYSPEISYRALREGIDANENTSETIENKNNKEIAQFGQSGSVFVGYKLSKMFSLEGGMEYTGFGHAENSTEIIAFGSEPFQDEVVGSKTKFYQLHVISIPIRFHASIGQNRLKAFASVGVAPGMLVRYIYSTRYEYFYGSTTTVQTYSEGEQEKFSRFHLGAQVSAGIDFRFSQKASFRIAPVFRITTNSVFAAKEIRANYFNAGINVGMIYSL